MANAGSANVSSESATFAFRSQAFGGSDSDKATCISVYNTGENTVHVQCLGDPGHHGAEEWYPLPAGTSASFEVQGLGPGRIHSLSYKLPGGGGSSGIVWSVTKVRG